MTSSGQFFRRSFADPAVVRLMDEDADLFVDLPDSGRAEARARAVAPVLRLSRGRWDASVLDCDPAACLGLLVLDGLLVHSVIVASEPRSEIIGPGDVLRPWQQEDAIASVPFTSEWQVVHPARVAVLDHRLVAFGCRWPQFTLTIVQRLVGRSHRLALQLAITDMRRVEDRLMLLLWHLADRWGRVRPDGVHVPLPVTHDVLAQLVCAQRPTVTTALKRLSESGRIARQRDRSWLLAPGGPPAVLRARRRLEAAAV